MVKTTITRPRDCSRRSGRPEPVGDYFAGPNHVLPTGGRAKFSSVLGVWDFVKKTTITRYSRERLRRESAAIGLFAEREHLYAHAEAVRARNIV